MGILDTFREKQRIKMAAKQMWEHVRRGANFEVPLRLDKNDLTLQAVAEMQRQHPEVEMRLYQSKGIVVGLFRGPSGMKGNHGISNGVLDHFNRSGHIEDGFRSLTAEDLLARHEAFLVQQGLDAKEQEKLAQEERMKRERIELSGSGKLETQPAAADDSLGLLKLAEDIKALAEKPNGSADVE